MVCELNLELVLGLVDLELVWMRVLGLVPVTVTGLVIGRIWWAAWNIGDPKRIRER